MNISEILSPKFTEFDIGTPLSKVAGAFENQELDAVVVTDGDEYRGVVSRRQLASSSNQPSAKVDHGYSTSRRLIGLQTSERSPGS